MSSLNKIKVSYKGSAEIWWLALLSYSETVLGLNKPAVWSLSVWSLHSFPEPS